MDIAQRCGGMAFPAYNFDTLVVYPVDPDGEIVGNNRIVFQYIADYVKYDISCCAGLRLFLFIVGALVVFVDRESRVAVLSPFRIDGCYVYLTGVGKDDFIAFVAADALVVKIELPVNGLAQVVDA